jgi:HSP20 family protein
MNLEKLKPWNWFKHESGENTKQQVPVTKETAKQQVPGVLDTYSQFQHELEQWFDRLWQATNFWPSVGNQLPASIAKPTRLSNWLGEVKPQIDVAGDKDSYEITLDVPGFTKDNLAIEIVDDALIIKGTKEEKVENNDKHYYCVERRLGQFQRTLALPKDADKDAIDATLEHGVLTLKIARKAQQQKQGKQIAIKS